MISDEERREAARKLRNAEERTMMELTDGELLDLLAEAVGLDRYESEHFEGGLFYCLADLIDRPTCCNVYDEICDEYEGGRCENGFKCSKCGEIVEDCEGYRVTGTFNYCPKCGREVVSE